MREIIRKRARFIIRIMPLVLIAGWATGVQASMKTDSLRYEILLTGKMADRLHLNEKFVPSLDITSNRLILLSTNHQFYQLGWGGLVPYGKPVSGEIGSFAITPDSLLMVIRSLNVCTFGTDGILSDLFRLPSYRMGISSGKYVMYVYDQSRDKSKHSLYVVAKGGKYARIFDLPSPIVSVAELNNSFYVATANALLRYNPVSRKIMACSALPGKQEIRSVTADTSSGMIFFATNNSIFVLKDSVTVKVSDAMGGIVRFFNGGLIVFNPEKKYIIRITGLEGIIGSAQVGKKPAEASLPVSEPKQTPPPREPAPVKETQAQPVQETPAAPDKELRSQAKYIAERFITNTSGNLEKGKTYILKKDFSVSQDLLNTFPDGSILKLVGTDPGASKSWKVIKPSDGVTALIDSKLYMYFEQAHVWVIKLKP